MPTVEGLSQRSHKWTVGLSRAWKLDLSGALASTLGSLAADR